MTLDHDINGLYEPRDVTKLCFCHHLKRHIMLDPQHVADLGALQCRRGLNKKRIAYFHFTKEDSEAAKKKVQMEISVLSAFLGRSTMDGCDRPIGWPHLLKYCEQQWTLIPKQFSENRCLAQDRASLVFVLWFEVTPMTEIPMRKKLVNAFLERHGFADLNDPRDLSDVYQVVRMKATCPIQVAQEVGNEAMVKLLMEAKRDENRNSSLAFEKASKDVPEFPSRRRGFAFSEIKLVDVENPWISCCFISPVHANSLLKGRDTWLWQAWTAAHNTARAGSARSQPPIVSFSCSPATMFIRHPFITWHFYTCLSWFEFQCKI